MGIKNLFTGNAHKTADKEQSDCCNIQIVPDDAPEQQSNTGTDDQQSACCEQSTESAKK
ncbi:hypothetical protein I2485_15330 [Nesterenkonia sp. E16_7]|uniref:hypothetical protein n=1 Tax=unclassified Nesterenkonia TaxID=2629769 RepID=UPI001A932DA2|nr:MULTISPECIES: hypothetical protein [unclassified Nesterenkonia]MBO0596784.1 hypothetical protein [Nesterenkonia sp. E16_10]MBO0600020.1 hypothetical protein [Nesterenkonia sp. E16_7]